MVRRSTGSANRPAWICFRRWNCSLSESASLILFSASSLAAKSSSLPVMLAVHQARADAICSGWILRSCSRTNSLALLLTSCDAAPTSCDQALVAVPIPMNMANAPRRVATWNDMMLLTNVGSSRREEPDLQLAFQLDDSGEWRPLAPLLPDGVRELPTSALLGLM